MNPEIIELVRWPLVVIALGAFAIAVLRTPLTALVPRLKRAGSRGVEFDPPEQSTESPASIEAAQELMHAWDNQLLVEQEGKIRALLEERGITELDEREQVLIRLTAAATIQTQMEQIYTEILGTQVEALRTVNQHSAGVSGETLEPHFDTARSIWADALSEFTFETWFAYIQNRLLVVEEEGRWRITVLGREFLMYLVETGKPEKLY